MINEIFTYLKSTTEVRRVIKAAREKHAYITTNSYMYDISKISIDGDRYRLELSHRIPLQMFMINNGTRYAVDSRPETNMYINKDAFNRLVSVYSEWNTIDKKVMLYYNRL